MTDPFIQRFDGDAFEDERDARREARERADRALDYAPTDPCRDCHQLAVEVEPSRWECGC